MMFFTKVKFSHRAQNMPNFGFGAITLTFCRIKPIPHEMHGDATGLQISSIMTSLITM